MIETTPTNPQISKMVLVRVERDELEIRPPPMVAVSAQKIKAQAH